jgi:hypothetical protein
MLVLNAITLFYYDLCYSTGGKPTGVIENWNKKVHAESFAKSMSNGKSATTRPSATLVPIGLSSRSSRHKKIEKLLNLIDSSDKQYLGSKAHKEKKGAPLLKL